jgi:hypothetical protein
LRRSCKLLPGERHVHEPERNRLTGLNSGWFVLLALAAMLLPSRAVTVTGGTADALAIIAMSYQ